MEARWGFYLTLSFDDLNIRQRWVENRSNQQINWPKCVLSRTQQQTNRRINNRQLIKSLQSALWVFVYIIRAVFDSPHLLFIQCAPLHKCDWYGTLNNEYTASVIRRTLNMRIQLNLSGSPKLDFFASLFFSNLLFVFFCSPLGLCRFSDFFSHFYRVQFEVATIRTKTTNFLSIFLTICSADVSYLSKYNIDNHIEPLNTHRRYVNEWTFGLHNITI